MQNPTPMTPAERELESALGALRPIGPAIDRDRLMFHAGQASAIRRCHVWQALAAVLAVAACASMAIRLTPRPVPSVANESTGSTIAGGTEMARWPDDADRPTVPAENGYLHLRNIAMTQGIDALPAAVARASAQPPLTLRQLLETRGAEEDPKIDFHEPLGTIPQGDEL